MLTDRREGESSKFGNGREAAETSSENDKTPQTLERVAMENKKPLQRRWRNFGTGRSRVVCPEKRRNWERPAPTP